MKNIHEVGCANPLNIDLSAVSGIGRVLGPYEEAPPVDDRERVARYLYLNAVLDQGRDSVGVGMLLSSVVNRLEAELGIDILGEPLSFFANVEDAIRIIEDEHQNVRITRSSLFPNITHYSLYDQYRVTPWVAFRWGAPLLNIVRFARISGGLLKWLDGFPSGEAAAIAVKSDDRYGLGGAIGKKASRLFIKWVAFTARLDPAWPHNSYEVPLDANVGRVLMRSGYLFVFLDPSDMEKGNPKPWTTQAGGRVNLSAQSLNDRPLAHQHDMKPELLNLSEMWGLGRRTSNIRIMKTLNVLLDRSLGEDGKVGHLDDGFMKVGRDYCKNTDPLDDTCPVRDGCLAHQTEPILKTTFYCGSGAGIFR